MPSLYGGAYKATNGFGSLGINPNAGSGAIGFEFGDAAGLGNTSGVLGSAAAVPEPVPVRKNPPPRRKKKGGPGRKKAVPVPAANPPSTTQTLDTVTTDTPTDNQSQPALPGFASGDTQPQVEEAEGSGSDSDDDGSEEGEIGEETESQTQPQWPVPEQITPEPSPPSAEREQIVETTTPLDADTTVPEASSQAPQELLESPIGPAEENMPVSITTELVAHELLPEPAIHPSIQEPVALVDAETVVQAPLQQPPQASPEPSSNAVDLAAAIHAEPPATEQVVHTLEGPTLQPAPAEVEVIEASTSELVPEIAQDPDMRPAPTNDVEMQDTILPEAVVTQPDIPAAAPEGEGEVDLLGGLEAAVDKEADASAASNE